jgi:hypothetical protein
VGSDKGLFNTLLVSLAAAGTATEMRVEQLAQLELAHPTYTDIIGVAARQLVRELGIMPLVPHWHSLGV